MKKDVWTNSHPKRGKHVTGSHMTFRVYYYNYSICTCTITITVDVSLWYTLSESTEDVGMSKPKKHVNMVRWDPKLNKPLPYNST